MKTKFKKVKNVLIIINYNQNCLPINLRQQNSMFTSLLLHFYSQHSIIQLIFLY